MNEAGANVVMGSDTDAASVAGDQAAPVLEARGLGKTFRQGPQEVEVLRGVDMIVRRGQRLAIVGSSGSGKSTLLHCLGGLERPSHGEVLWAGQNPMGLSEKARGLLRNHMARGTIRLPVSRGPRSPPCCRVLDERTLG